MINVVKLRVLAAEYVKEVSALLSNEFFIARKKEEAFDELFKEYETLKGVVQSGGMGEIPKRKKMEKALDDINDAISKAREAFEGRKQEEQWAAELGEQKINAIESLLGRVGIRPNLRDKAVDFIHGDGPVIMSLPYTANQ